MYSVSDVPAAKHMSNVSGTLLANSSAVSSSFNVILNHFDKMLNKNAFVHQYLSEGMDISEFHEAASNVKDLISEYQ